MTVVANRFTDTAKWVRPWFRTLGLHQKLLWLYLCDTCDIAGIWIEDFETASMHIGQRVSLRDLTVFGSRIQRISDDKFWVSRFVEFQYKVGPKPDDKKLNPANKVHLSVIRSLERNGIDSSLWRNDLPVPPQPDHSPSPMHGAKDKDKDKEKEKEKEEGGSGEDRVLPEVALAIAEKNGDTQDVGLFRKWFRSLGSSSGDGPHV